MFKQEEQMASTYNDPIKNMHVVHAGGNNWVKHVMQTYINKSSQLYFCFVVHKSFLVGFF